MTEFRVWYVQRVPDIMGNKHVKEYEIRSRTVLVSNGDYFSVRFELPEDAKIIEIERLKDENTPNK